MKDTALPIIYWNIKFSNGTVKEGPCPGEHCLYMVVDAISPVRCHHCNQLIDWGNSVDRATLTSDGIHKFLVNRGIKYNLYPYNKLKPKEKQNACRT